MDSTIYLPNFDKAGEFLAYTLPKGTWRILSAQELKNLGVKVGFGDFTRENDHVGGVFGTPEGPVFFLDAERVQAPFGEVTAAVVDVAPTVKRFTLSRGGKKVFELTYRERHGIGTNPYDQTPEDVDLFARMAAGTRKEQFFKVYTRAA